MLAIETSRNFMGKTIIGQLITQGVLYLANIARAGVLLAIEAAKAVALNISTAFKSFSKIPYVGWALALAAAAAGAIWISSKISSSKKSGDLSKRAGEDVMSSPTVGSFFRDKGTDYIPDKRDDVVFGENIIDKINKPTTILQQDTPEFNISTTPFFPQISSKEQPSIDFNVDAIKDFQLGNVAKSFNSFIENSKSQMEEFKNIFKEKQTINLEATISNPVDSYASKYVHYKQGDESSFATNVTDFA
jgi:hypothetical protein